jgi:hypothetical protein
MQHSMQQSFAMDEKKIMTAKAEKTQEHTSMH